MDPVMKIPPLHLKGETSGGNDSFSNDPSTAPAVPSPSAGTKDEKNFIRNGHIDYKSQMKRHTEKENEISIGDQVRSKTTGRSFTQLTQPNPKEYARERHLAEEIPNASSASSATGTPRSTHTTAARQQDRPSHRLSSRTFDDCGHRRETEWERNAVEELRRQNRRLLEALLKVQKNHSTEKKRFHEILLGVDKALSSLPIRLEKIRVRNQRNLSVLNTSRFCNVTENPAEPSTCESAVSEDSSTVTSQDSHLYLSTRMRCLQRKMEQLNDLVDTIQKGESSPVELLLNSELCAISLLKKEIRSTKKQIEENGTESETVTSCKGSHREDAAEDSSSKAKNSFSNELNKASNFKIFENHMILQEEALNLLTRKIKETEEALVREVEAKEGLQREKEAMAKEIFRLKSTGEESKGEKSEKMEKLKAEAEATGNRPYRLIKELRAKLEEKEKSLIAWKSKCSRLEAGSANKTVLMESERKKNVQLEALVKNLKVQNKAKSSQVNSLQLLNEQLRNQMDILRHQVEEVVRERVDLEVNSGGSRNSKMVEQVNELSDMIQIREAKVKKVEKNVENKLNKLQESLEEARCRLAKCQQKNEEFSKTFKELLVSIHGLAAEKELKSINHPSHKRIREILNITPSDLHLLYSVYVKSINEKEVEKLHDEFKAIVDGEEVAFSEHLSTWFFRLLREKLLPQTGGESGRVEA